MDNMNEFFKALVKWLSFKGRINRIDYLLLHLLPITLLILINNNVFHFSGVSFFCVWIAAAGFVKRLKDINVKNIGLKVISGLSIWVVISGIVVVVGIIYFLQGISGLGNKDLVESAALLLAIPILLIILFPLIVSFIPGSSNENKYGSVPETSSSWKGTLKLIAFIILPLAISLFGYIALQPSDPPLIQAIKNRNLESFNELLDEGANPNQNGLLGTTALILALETNQDSLAISLLDAGADPNATSTLKIRGQDSTIKTPLTIAIDQSLDVKVIEKLLEKGADVNPVRMNYNDTSPMLMAVYRGDTLIVKMLIDHGVDLNAVLNETPLHVALDYEKLDVIKILLKGEIDMNQLTSELEIIDNYLKSDRYSKKYRILEELLKVAVNKQAGKEIYPIYPVQSFFKEPLQKIKSLTTFKQQLFRKPQKARFKRAILLRKGPGVQYDEIDSFFDHRNLVLVAITDVGDEFVWFKVKNNMGEGYVNGAYLCSRSDWYIGLSDCGMVYIE
tara:strand:+ start:23 stop:1537 length:1515 start_codon:yes stop_codon:yes gene_type:complete